MLNRHRSNAEELMDDVPIVKVKGNVALCDGGGGALGHPIEYINLDTKNPLIPSACKYCGVLFMRDPAYH